MDDNFKLGFYTYLEEQKKIVKNLFYTNLFLCCIILFILVATFIYFYKYKNKKIKNDKYKNKYKYLENLNNSSYHNFYKMLFKHFNSISNIKQDDNNNLKNNSTYFINSNKDINKFPLLNHYQFPDNIQSNKLNNNHHNNPYNNSNYYLPNNNYNNLSNDFSNHFVNNKYFEDLNNKK